MIEPYYSLLCWGIRLSPALFMILAWVICYYRYATVVSALLITFFIGYLTGVISVWIYWDFAAYYAPTSDIADEILSKDGAPRLLAPLVMPIFVVIYFAMMWPFAWGITWLFPRPVMAEQV